VPVAIRPDTVVAGWTFEGDIPGPVVHVRQGDTVEFTLTNEGAVPHSMDFHAAQIDPRVAFRSVASGESVTYTFMPRYAGAFMYHCGTAPVLMHIGAGMYGAIIVDPPTPLPPAKEFVLVQSEFYLAPAQNGIQAFDYNRMMSTLPDFVAFNGRPGIHRVPRGRGVARGVARVSRPGRAAPRRGRRSRRRGRSPAPAGPPSGAGRAPGDPGVARPAAGPRTKSWATLTAIIVATATSLAAMAARYRSAARIADGGRRVSGTVGSGCGVNRGAGAGPSIVRQML
jgi:hypothetical protein